MKKDTKQRLFEVMSRLDPSFKVLNEEVIRNYVHDGPLYRSITIAGFVKIMTDGYISTDALSWNKDPRKGIFFSTELNTNTIGQGEDIERATTTLMMRMGKKVPNYWNPGVVDDDGLPVFYNTTGDDNNPKDYKDMYSAIHNWRKRKPFSSIIMEIETKIPGTLFTGSDSLINDPRDKDVDDKEVLIEAKSIPFSDWRKVHFIKDLKIVESYTKDEFFRNKNKIWDRFFDMNPRDIH
ncbi:MAG: hypothetical protein ACOC22_00415 [bacterium]